MAVQQTRKEGEVKLPTRFSAWDQDLILLLDDAGRPHREVQPKLFCEPHPIATIYRQSIIGVGIAGRKCACHDLSCSRNKIANTLAERVSKPDMALAID